MLKKERLHLFFQEFACLLIFKLAGLFMPAMQ